MSPADRLRGLAFARGPGADGDVVPIGDPEEDEGYGDDDDEDDDEDEEDEEEPWQVAGIAVLPLIRHADPHVALAGRREWRVASGECLAFNSAVSARAVPSTAH